MEIKCSIDGSKTTNRLENKIVILSNNGIENAQSDYSYHLGEHNTVKVFAVIILPTLVGLPIVAPYGI